MVLGRQDKHDRCENGGQRKGSREGTRQARTQNIDSLVNGLGQLSEQFLQFGTL
jgi:hypothetical protein